MATIGFNKVILVGNLGSAPFSSGGNAIQSKTGVLYTFFNIAINEYKKDSSGMMSRVTEWIKVVCFGRTAENACRYLKKGSTVHVEGKLRSSEYTDKITSEKKTALEVVCDPNGLIFLERVEDCQAHNISSAYENMNCNPYKGTVDSPYEECRENVKAPAAEKNTTDISADSGYNKDTRISCDTVIPEAQALNTVCFGRSKPEPYCAYEAPALNSIMKSHSVNENNKAFEELKALFDKELPF
jgi:single stranded DNA-binding protein